MMVLKTFFCVDDEFGVLRLKIRPWLTPNIKISIVYVLYANRCRKESKNFGYIEYGDIYFVRFMTKKVLTKFDLKGG